MYTCSICGARVKTRQGLAGHHRFRHEDKGYPSNYRPVEKDPGQQPATSDEVLELRKLVESLTKQVGQQSAAARDALNALSSMQPIGGRLDRIEDEIRQIKQRGESTERKLDQFLGALAKAQEDQRRAASDAATAEAWAGVRAAMAELVVDSEAYLDEARRAGAGDQVAKLKEFSQLILAELRQQTTRPGSPKVKKPERPNADPWLRNTPMHRADP